MTPPAPAPLPLTDCPCNGDCPACTSALVATLRESLTAAECDRDELRAALKGLVECPDCEGHGFGPMRSNGIGDVWDEKCGTCDGLGAVSKSLLAAKVRAETALRQAQAERDAAREREARLVAAAGAAVAAFDVYNDTSPEDADEDLRTFAALEHAVSALDDLVKCEACGGYGDDGDAVCQTCGGTRVRSTPTPTTDAERPYDCATCEGRGCAACGGTGNATTTDAEPVSKLARGEATVATDIATGEPSILLTTTDAEEA